MSKFQLICAVYAKISYNSIVTNYAFIENLIFEKTASYSDVMKLSTVVLLPRSNKYFGFLFSVR